MKNFRTLARGVTGCACLWLLNGELFLARGAASLPRAGAISIQIPGFTMKGDSTSWTIVALMTLLTLLPRSASFRYAICPHSGDLSLSATGARHPESTPANQTLIGLSLFLTYFLMQPVALSNINQQALNVPPESGAIDTWQAIDRGSVPLREFMLRYTREKDLALFVDMAQQARPKQPDDLPMRVVIPAYILFRARKQAFRIGRDLVLAVSGDRHGHCFGDHVYRDDATAPGGDLHAFKDPTVRGC